MSVDTKVKLKGFVSHNDIFRIIKERYDPNATCNVKREKIQNIKDIKRLHFEFNEHSDSNTEWYDINGYIDFKYCGEVRSLYYQYMNLNFFENLEYYSRYGLEDMVRSECTLLDLGCWGSSVSILTEIASHFGGWIDENDSDGIPYHWIERMI